MKTWWRHHELQGNLLILYQVFTDQISEYESKLIKCCCPELGNGRVAAGIGINHVIGFIHLFNHDFIYSTTGLFIKYL